MTSKPEEPVLKEMTAIVRTLLRRCAGKPIKGLEHLAAGKVAHVITVQRVTRKVKVIKSLMGDEKYKETTPIGSPLCHWLFEFEQPRSVWNFVREIEQRFPDFGFFVQDKIKAPTMRLEDYPELGATISAELARVGAVAVRKDRTKLHGSWAIAMVNCQYPPGVASEAGQRLPSVDNLLFAFPSTQSVADFMNAVKRIYDSKLAMCVLIVQTPNLCPVQPRVAGGSSGVGMIRRSWPHTTGNEGPKQIAFAAV